MNNLKQQLVAQAASEGFEACQICTPTDIPHVPARLMEYLDNGYHGEMAWMADRVQWRGDPTALWPEVKSVIVLAENYTPQEDPMANLKSPDLGTISVYARNKDYHDVVKKRLKRLARWLIAKAGGDVKVFVDTAPVAEKPLGQASGLGWLGKHTNLVSQNLGSWFFIGSIFTTLEIDPDTAETDHCGSCRACLDVCPTDAFPAPYQLDARRCISYLTIEHKGPVDEYLRPLLGNRIYGCDDCLAACPWNKFAQDAQEFRYHAKPELVSPSLDELARLTDAKFRQKFSGSPIKRIGRNRFVRNVLYAIGNSENPEHIELVKALQSDPDPVVSDAAIWALNRLQDAANGQANCG